MQDRQLTEFQSDCEARLRSRLEREGRRLVGREITGEKVSDIHGFVEETDIEIWIYEDEAEFCRANKYRVFETPDFDSSEELIDAFIEAVAEEIRRVNEK